MCCGEGLIDMVPTSGKSNSVQFRACPGGSVFNTAIGLGRLGTNAGFISGLSSDFFGDLLRETLRESNVDTTHVILSDRPSTLAFVTLENSQARYTFFHENSAGRMLSAEQIPVLPKSVTTLFLGGG